MSDKTGLFVCTACGAMRYGIEWVLNGAFCGLTYTSQATWDDDAESRVCEGILEPYPASVPPTEEA